MRAMIWLIGIFALAAGVAMLAGLNDGYVLLVLPPWRAQLSLNLLVVLLVAGFLIGYLLLRLLSGTFGLPSRMTQWRARRRREKAGKALHEAISALFEGRFPESLKAASNAYAKGEESSIAALVAARAAHGMRDDVRYREWLERAAEHGEESEVARLMTEADLATLALRFDEADARLRTLREKGHHHIAMLRLESRVASALGRWEELVSVVRQLRKQKAFTDEQAAMLLRRAHAERIKELSGDAAAMAAYWKDIPAAELQDRGLIEEVLPLMAAAGLGAMVKKQFESLLDETWDSNLARLYAHCAEGDGDANACLHKAESWLQSQPRDAGLLFALGRLCVDAQLWGKAQSYLEASLNLDPAVDTHLALAHLLDKLDRAQEAQLHYRAAAEKVAGSEAAAARPRGDLVPV